MTDQRALESRLRAELGSRARVVTTVPLVVEATWEYDDESDARFLQAEWDGPIAGVFEGGALVGRPREPGEQSANVPGVNCNLPGVWARPFEVELSFEYHTERMGVFAILLNYFTNPGPNYRVDFGAPDNALAFLLDENGNAEPIESSPIDPFPPGGRTVLRLEATAEGEHRISVGPPDGVPFVRIDARDVRVAEGSLALYLASFEEFRIERLVVRGRVADSWAQRLGD